MDLSRLINALGELSNPIFNKDTDLQTWKGKTVNVLNRIYGANSNQEEQIKSIKLRRFTRVSTVGSRPSGPNHNGNDCAKQANELIISFIKDLQEFGVPKLIEEKNQQGINISVNQNQSQNQTMNLQLILDIIRNELPGKEVKEIENIINDKNINPEKKKSKIVDKIKSFGKDVVANILAGIVTNPALFGG
jgi:hypothetical protein|tara:strand:- start:84 stop:656 length:573 start_codon:yes stop_codon:yes gene_type:complete